MATLQDATVKRWKSIIAIGGNSSTLFSLIFWLQLIFYFCGHKEREVIGAELGREMEAATLVNKTIKMYAVNTSLFI